MYQIARNLMVQFGFKYTKGGFGTFETKLEVHLKPNLSPKLKNLKNFKF